jgi:YD repeat-containing protein
MSLPAKTADGRGIGKGDWFEPDLVLADTSACWERCIEAIKDERAQGATYTFGYDALGRQSSITDGSNPTSWSYFGNSSESAKAGWLKSMTKPAGTTSYTYYAIGDSGGSVGQLNKVGKQGMLSF